MDWAGAAAFAARHPPPRLHHSSCTACPPTSPFGHPPARLLRPCVVLQVQSVSTSLSPELQQEVMNEARKQAVQSGAATARLLAQASS